MIIPGNKVLELLSPTLHPLSKHHKCLKAENPDYNKFASPKKLFVFSKVNLKYEQKIGKAIFICAYFLFLIQIISYSLSKFSMKSTQVFLGLGVGQAYAILASTSGILSYELWLILGRN